MEPSTPPQPPTTGQPTTDQLVPPPIGASSKRKRLIVGIIAALFVIVSGFAGMYAWQHRDLSSENDTTQEQLIVGQVDFDNDHKRGTNDEMFIDGLIEPGDLDEAWIEYGTDPDALNQQTDHIGSELGEGEAGTYSNYGFTLHKDKLTAGATYFYRVAASQGEDTIYSGLASFSAQK